MEREKFGKVQDIVKTRKKPGEGVYTIACKLANPMNTPFTLRVRWGKETGKRIEKAAQVNFT